MSSTTAVVAEECSIKTIATKSTSISPNSIPPKKKQNLSSSELCHVCRLVAFQYQCPRCSIRTCSLKCCQHHKIQTKCNGKRDMTKFLPLCQMSDSTLQSDYHFLEKVCQSIPHKNRNNNAHKSSKKQKLRMVESEQEQEEPAHPILQQHRLNESGTSALLQLSLEEETDNATNNHGDNHHNNNNNITEQLTTITTTSNDKNKEKNSQDAATQSSQPLISSLMTKFVDTHTNNATSNNNTQDNSTTKTTTTATSALPPPPQPSSAAAAAAAARNMPSTTMTACPKVRKLVLKSKERGTTLMIMPPFMERRKQNTTYYHPKTNMVYWKVEFVIPRSSHEENEQKSNTVIVDSKLAETLTIQSSKPLQSYFATRNTAQQPQSPYHYLLKQLPCPSNQPRYVSVQPEHTLQEALQGMTVIEYPTIYVVPTPFLHLYPQTIQEMSSQS